MKLISPSLRCIQVIAGVLGRAGESGQAKRLLAAKTGEITWLPPPGLGKPFDEEAEKRKAEEAAKKKKEGEEKKARAASGDPEDDYPEELAAEPLGLNMKDLVELGEELSEGDKKIVEKIKQLRNKRGARDEDPLSEEDMELVRTMESEREVDEEEGDSKARLEFKMELEEIQKRFHEDLRRLEEKMK